MTRKTATLIVLAGSMICLLATYLQAATPVQCSGDADACARTTISITLPPPIPPPNPTTDAVCTDNGWQVNMTSACIAGKQNVQRAHTWTTVTPASGNPVGKSCPLAVTETIQQDCAMPPMPPDPSLPAPAVGYTTVRIGLSPEKPSVPEDGAGAFRTIIGVSHFSYNDPIVFPRQTGASHCHSFFGNTSTDANSTAASMQAANSTTAHGGIVNETAYWFPCLRDAAGKIVIPQSLQAYYKSGYNAIPMAKIEPIPMALAFIAGRKPTDIGPDTSGNPQVYFECYPAGYPTRQQYIPSCNAGSGAYLLASVTAPNCWDGVNLDSPDHRSHMAYSYGGSCPASHPHPIPQISLNVAYPIATNTNGWKFSSDTAPGVGGYSFHADYWNFWDPATELIWLNNCTKKPMDCHTDNLGDVAAFPPNGRRLN